MAQEIILTENLTAEVNGHEISSNYVAILVLDESKAPVIRVEQSNGAPTGGRWFLETLEDGGVSDAIYIDFGQKWLVTSGMIEAVAEANRVLSEMDSAA